MKLKLTKGINYPVLDSLSDNGQRLYLFLLTQNGKKVNFEAYAAILHLTLQELGIAFVEVITALDKK